MKRTSFLMLIFVLSISFALNGCSAPVLAIPSDFEYSSDEGIAIIKYQGKNNKIIIPDLIDDMPIRWIVYHAFSSTDIKSVEIPDSVEWVAPGVFFGCEKLTEVKLPASIEWVEENLFENCSSLKTVEIPEKVVGIAIRAFYGCKSLETITVPKNVEIIQEEAFSDCPKLKSIIFEGNAPELTGSIGDGDFTVYHKKDSVGFNTLEWDNYNIEILE